MLRESAVLLLPKDVLREAAVFLELPVCRVPRDVLREPLDVCLLPKDVLREPLVFREPVDVERELPVLREPVEVSRERAKSVCLITSVSLVPIVLRIIADVERVPIVCLGPGLT